MKIGYILSILCLIIALCYAETFEVSSAAEVAEAALLVQPGGIPNQYSVRFTGSTWKSQNIYFTAYGTNAKPIYLDGNGVKITDKSKLHLGGRYIIAYNLNFAYGYSDGGASVVEFREKDTIPCEYCTIRKSYFTSINPSSLSDKYTWIELHGKHNTFTNNTISNKKHIGPTIVSFQDSGEADYHVISYNNFIGRPTYNDQQNEQETIRLGDSSAQYATYTTVEHNVFYEQNGELEVVSSKSNKNVFRYNSFIRCKGALTLRRADYNEVYGNQFIGDGVSLTSGIRVVWGKGHIIYNNYCENLGDPGTGAKDRACIAIGNGDSSASVDGYQMVTGLTFVFNTARGCKQTIALGSGRGAYPPSRSLFAHNIFSFYILEADTSFVNFYTTPSKINYYNNYIWGEGTQPENITGFIFQNPKFSKSDSYLLNSNSPVDEVNSELSWLTSDITEYSRNSNSATPGCYQLRT